MTALPADPKPQALDKANRLFSPVTALALVGVGVFAFAALLVLQTYAPDLHTESDGGEHALSKSAVGYAALVTLLKDAGDPVVVSRGPIHANKAAPGILVLTPGPETDPKALTKIHFDGPALIVLPKWAAAPDPLRKGWVMQAGTLPQRLVGKVLPKSVVSARLKVVRADGVTQPVMGGAPGPLAGQSLPLGDVQDFQTMDSAELVPVLTDAQGHMVLGRVRTDDDDNADAAAQAASPQADTSQTDAPQTNAPPAPVAAPQTDSSNDTDGKNQDQDAGKTTPAKPPTPMQVKGDIYVLSDPDLLDTHGLKNLANARAAVTVLDALRGGKGPIALDVTLHGYARGRSILKLAFEPPFLGLTLALVGAAMLMGWHAYARFGPTPARSRAIAFGKGALVDNSSALIRVARREPHMAPGYVNLVRNLVAHLTGAPRDLDRAELDALLDKIGAAKGAEDKISTLAEDAEGLKDNGSLMRVAAKLHRWRTEMTRERQ